MHFLDRQDKAICRFSLRLEKMCSKFINDLSFLITEIDNMFLEGFKMFNIIKKHFKPGI